MLRTLRCGLSILSILLLCVGCKSAPKADASVPSEPVESSITIVGVPQQLPVIETVVPSAPSAEFIIGHSREGRPIHCRMIGEGTECVLIIAGIHGNESAGVPVAQRLATELRDHPYLLDGRRVLIVAEANPDGLAARQRTNAAGVDLNRNFPAANHSPGVTRGYSPLTEPESKALYHLIELFRPVRIISVHQPLSCVDYDGPAESLAAAVARAGNLPIKRLGARPGSLGSFAGVDLGIPIVTLELPKGAEQNPADVLWNQYGSSLIAGIGPLTDAKIPPTQTVESPVDDAE